MARYGNNYGRGGRAGGGGRSNIPRQGPAGPSRPSSGEQAWAPYSGSAVDHGYTAPAQSYGGRAGENVSYGHDFLNPASRYDRPDGGQGAGGEEGDEDEVQYSSDPFELGEDVISAYDEILAGGPEDTSDELALLEQLYAGKFGSGMADLSAQFGGMGMGESGALMGAGADLQGRLAQQAGADMIGVDERAREQWLRELMAAQSAGLGERGAQLDEDSYANDLALAESLLEGEDEAPLPINQQGMEFLGLDPNRHVLTQIRDRLFPGDAPDMAETDSEVVGSVDDIPPGAVETGRIVNGHVEYKIQTGRGTFYYLVPQGRV